MASKTKSKRRTASCDQWLRLILGRHDGQPQDQTRVSRAQQWEVCLRKCHAVRGLAMRSRALVGEVLRQMSESNAPGEHEVVRERWQGAQKATRSRLLNKFTSLEACANKNNRQRSSSPNFHPIAPMSTIRDVSSSDESAMGEAARMMGARNQKEMFDRGNASSDSENPDDVADDDDRDSILGNASEIDEGAIQEGQQPPTKVGSLLQQLKKEPSNAEECASKFMLYEAYSSEVEDMRETLIKFHEESLPLLPPVVATNMATEIRQIDSREAMAIPECTHHWFVYDMMHKAERNNLSMASKLDAFESKLQFLALDDQKQCPICLEDYNEVDKKAKTLACCHKVCDECWTRWSAFMQSAKRPVFCPCCHHLDFLATVKAEVGSTETCVNLSDSDGDISSRSCSFLTRGRNGSMMFGVPIEQTCAAVRSRRNPRLSL